MWRAIGMLQLIVVLTLGALAQGTQNVPLPLTGGLKPSAVETPSGDIGTFASDLIPGNGTRAGYLLRYAPVLAGSETVYVDGKRMKREVDYWLDGASGTLAFAEPVRRFSTITVTYRYSKGAKSTNGTPVSPLVALSFGKTGGVQALMATGQAEQRDDGSVWQANAYGLRDVLRFGQGSTLEGYYLLATYKPVQSFASPLMPDPAQPPRTASTQSQFIFQRLNIQEGALRFNLLYQDIGAGFSAQKFLQAQQGLDPAQIAQWEKEKGIRRFGYSFGLNLGQNSAIDYGTARITDGKGAITTQSFKLDGKQLGFYWNRREAEATFAHFDFLAEGKRGDWAREKGLVRENQGGHFALGFGQLKADQNLIKDLQGNILRRTINFDSGVLKFGSYLQQIDAGFTRFNDLAEGEKGQWARERGLTRDGWNLQFTPKGFGLSFNQGRIASDAGDVVSQSMKLTGSNWSFENIYRKVDSDFGRIGDLAPQEHQEWALETRRFYDPKAQNINDEERRQVLKERGLERTFQRATFAPGKNMQLDFSRLQIRDLNGGDLSGMLWRFQSPTLQFRMMDRTIADDFNRLGDLAPIERAAFANERGMHRREWEAAFTGKTLGLAIAQTQVQEGDAGMKKASYRLQTKIFDITLNQRSVDTNFNRIADLADPEKNLLAQLRGFHQQDWTAKLNLWKGMGIELLQFNADNPTEGISTSRRRGYFQWQPNTRTQITYNNDQLEAEGASTRIGEWASGRMGDWGKGGVGDGRMLVKDMYEKTTLNHALRWGQFNAYREMKQIGGTLANPLSQKTDYWKFQSQNFKHLNFTLENRRTQAEGAVSEDYKAYTAQYQVSKQLKLNVSETSAMREGAPDEINRLVQMEYTLKPGSVLTFSEGRKLVEGANGGRVLALGLTQTAWGKFAFGGAYQERRVDNTNTRAHSEFSLQTTQPLRFAILTNVQFAFRYSALADKGNWQKENKQFEFKANWGKHLIEVAYTGVFVPGQGRAVDRIYRFTSNPDPNSNWHFNMSYKARTLRNGKQHMIRNYHLDYKIGDRLKLVHDFQSLPEQANGGVPLGSLVQPVGFSQWALNWVLNPRLSIRSDYRIEWNDAQNQRNRRGGLTFVGTAASQINFEFGYRIDSQMTSGQKRTAHTFRAAYDRKLSADHFLVLGLEYTQYEHTHPDGRNNSTRATIEFKRVF